MPRLPMLFATAAVTALLLGLLTSRFDLSTGMTITLPRATYFVSNGILCFGVALFFCLFAFLYSVWIVPWSSEMGVWHFALSVLSVGLFIIASIGMDRFNLLTMPPAVAIPFLLVFSFSPVLFLLIQGFFILDGLRRCWPFLREWL
jgi:hypothetical protein